MTQKPHQRQMFCVIVVEVSPACSMAPLDCLRIPIPHMHMSTPTQYRILTDSNCPPVGRLGHYIMNRLQAKRQAGGKAGVQSTNRQTGRIVYRNASRESGRNKNICKVVADRQKRDTNRSFSKNATKASSKNGEKCLADLVAVRLERVMLTQSRQF